MKSVFLFFIFFIFSLSPNLRLVQAEDTPPLCLEAQQCVETSFPPVLGNCLSTDPTCPAVVRQLALTAQELADNSIGAYGCSTKDFTRASHCQRCFLRAKNLLQDLNRRDRGVFGNLITQAYSLVDIQGKERCSPFSGTKKIYISGNLDALSDITARPGGPTSFTDLANSSTFSTFISVFDRRGHNHSLVLYFFHTNIEGWEVAVYVDGSEVSGGVAGDPVLVGEVQLTFDQTGARPLPIPERDLSVAPDWTTAETKSIALSFIPFTELPAPTAINLSTQ